MKFLITGSSGFAGSHLASRLRARGHEVLGMSRGPLPRGGSNLKCDLRRWSLVREAVAGLRLDAVFHLAALTRPRESTDRPRRYYWSNLVGTLNLLEALRLHQPAVRMLFVSSSEVYAPAAGSRRLSEEAPLGPRNPYSSSKLLAEALCRQYHEIFGVKVVVARPFNHSGPGQSDRFVISSFCRQLARLEAGTNRPRVVEAGNLGAVRDFLDVRDVVAAYERVLCEASAGDIFNVCSGRGVAISELLERLMEVAGIQFKIKTSRVRERSGEPESIIGDPGKLHEKLGWKPRIALETTLADTLAFWRRSPLPADSA